MELITEYIKPELIVVAVVLYFLIEKETQVCQFQIFLGNLKKYLPEKAVYMVS